MNLLETRLFPKVGSAPKLGPVPKMGSLPRIKPLPKALRPVVAVLAAMAIIYGVLLLISPSGDQVTSGDVVDGRSAAVVLPEQAKMLVGKPQRQTPDYQATPR